MNKFMFALENLMVITATGCKAVLERSNNIIKDKAVLCHTITSNEPNYFMKEAEKRTSNRRK